MQKPCGLCFGRVGRAFGKDWMTVEDDEKQGQFDCIGISLAKYFATMIALPRTRPKGPAATTTTPVAFPLTDQYYIELSSPPLPSTTQPHHRPNPLAALAATAAACLSAEVHFKRFCVKRFIFEKVQSTVAPRSVYSMWLNASRQTDRL